MTQPIHPHHVSQLLEPALTEIVHAISDRSGLTRAEYEAKAENTWTLIESFQPRDAIDLMLTGQLVAFNAVFADATRDVLRGMVDTMKQRTQSSLISMVRLTQGHVDRLAKRGSQPYRTEVAVPQSAQRPTVMPEPPAEPPHQPEIATLEPAPRPAATAAVERAARPAVSILAMPEPPLRPAASATRSEAAANPREEETSWLDEPYQQWLIETPADLAAKAEAARATASHAKGASHLAAASHAAVAAALWEQVTEESSDVDPRHRDFADQNIPAMAANAD